MSRSKIFVADEQQSPATNFVTRWSRLKREAKHNIESTVTTDTVVEANQVDGKSETPVKMLTDEDMPDITLMTDDSDYTDFLSPGVSEALKKLALRKLFHSEVFNIRDGLDEYDDDFTQFEKLGDIVTSDMRHQVEMETKRNVKELLRQEENLSIDNDVDEAEAEAEAAISNRDNDNGNNRVVDSDLDNPQIDESQTKQGSQTVAEKLALNSLQSDRAENKENNERPYDYLDVKNNSDEK